MPEIDLSSAVPPEARWIKLRYEIIAQKPGARLLARVWTGNDVSKASVLEGSAGEVAVPLTAARRLNYQSPVTVRLKLKVIGYSTSENKALS